MENSVIRNLTQDCPHENCRLSCYGSMRTCAAWVPIYDKAGKIINNDPNVTHSEYLCHTCRKSWKVKEFHDRIEVS